MNFHRWNVNLMQLNENIDDVVIVTMKDFPLISSEVKKL